MRKVEQIVADAVNGIDGLFVAGVSGGADSVALLRALCAIGREVLVVSCNFHLRGEESDGDARFVASLCDALNVECIVADMDVDSHIRDHGGSVEMACRDLRYTLFRRLMQERDAARIAIAHNADDNIETLFINLMRGAGVEGLKGMSTDTGEILRPLLSVNRDEITEYLSDLGQEYRTDSTNLTDNYRRNFVRHRVLPLLEQRWPSARKSIATVQRNLSGEAAVVRHALRTARKGVLTWKEIAECGDPRTAIHRFATPHSPSTSQIDEMTAVATRRVPARVWTLADCEIHSERDGLHIAPKVAPEIPEYHWLTIPNTPDARRLMLHDADLRVCWLPEGSNNFQMRHPEDGDRFAPLGMGGTRLISDMLKEARLTRAERRAAVILTDANGRPVWIDSIKRSRLYLITPDTPQLHLVSANRALLSAIADRVK